MSVVTRKIRTSEQVWASILSPDKDVVFIVNWIHLRPGNPDYIEREIVFVGTNPNKARESYEALETKFRLYKEIQVWVDGKLQKALEGRLPAYWWDKTIEEFLSERVCEDSFYSGKVT